MTSYNPPQHPSAPLGPSAPISNRPIAPVRQEFIIHQQQEERLLPQPPERSDLKRSDRLSGRSDDPHRPATKQDLEEVVQSVRRDENGDTNNDISCNYNRYATKKTIGHGLLGSALITSNAMQLRTLILQKQRDTIWTVSLVLVCCSFLFQIGLGFILFVLARGDIQDRQKQTRMRRYNNFSLFIISIITGMNIIINILMTTINPLSFFNMPAATDSSLIQT